MKHFGIRPAPDYPADTPTFFDDDVQEELPEDRTLRYQRLKQLWEARMRPRELTELRRVYGPYEWGIEAARIEAIRQAIWDMEYDDRQALARWRAVVGGENG